MDNLGRGLKSFLLKARTERNRAKKLQNLIKDSSCLFKISMGCTAKT
jgi:hypothetical protein